MTDEKPIDQIVRLNQQVIAEGRAMLDACSPSLVFAGLGKRMSRRERFVRWLRALGGA